MAFTSVEEKRKYQWNIVHTRKDEFFSDKSCSVCGTKNKLLLHHTNPINKINSWIWSWGSKRRKEEIDKCIILCFSCHTSLHNKLRGRKEIVHGSTYAYNFHKCRCDKCSKAATNRVMKYKK